MFSKRSRHGLPARPFSHADGCKILAADPGVQIEWSEIRAGVWEAVCQCGKQSHYEPAPARIRLDPLDPATFRHGGGCEMREVTDPPVLRALLKVTEKEDYWWVQCGNCDFGWQTPFYAQVSVG
jgi:hypothetical protein